MSDKAVEFLNQLNDLISSTKDTTISQAKENLLKRIENAAKHGEGLTMWMHLYNIVGSIEQVMEFVY